MTVERYDGAELDRFRSVQRLAYDSAEEVARELVVGMTEKEAATRLGRLCRRRGADGFFHRPFAWFGDRTGFYWYRSRSEAPGPVLSVPRSAMPLHFFPTERRLEDGMAVILDVAPIRDGYCADIGYAFSHGKNARVDAARADLASFRDLILRLVRQQKGMRAIYDEVEAHLHDKGYESAHWFYPNHVLGHKVGRLKLRRLPSVRLGGFDVRTLGYLGEQMVRSWIDRRRAQTPLLNQDDDRPLEPGLWAMEPHIRKDGVGAKWEEMLVVTEADAYWLDDDLPHVRAWQAARDAA